MLQVSGLWHAHVLEFLHVVTKTFVACFPVHHAGC